jgi:N-acetylglucosaminyl-diphospho-decaprenol L-rhamnosyltransferase
MTNPETNLRRPPAVSAIIVNYNAGDDLSRCVGSLMGQVGSIEVIVVDNGSRDGSVQQAIEKYPEIRVLPYAVNDGFAGGANRGVASATAGTLLFLNPDVVLEPGCVEALLEVLDSAPGTTLCAPVLVDSAGQRVEYGFTIDWAGDLVALSSPKPPLYVSGCAFAMTREVFTALGGFDSEFFMFCEDLDLCWRALLHGYKVRVVSGARARHRGGGSTPGGYISRGRIEVTAFRIALRERNTLAALVRCGPMPWTALVVALRVGRIGVIALLATLSGRLDLARGLAKGVAWNLRRFPELWRQRNEMPATPSFRRQLLRERMLHDFSQVRVLIRHGLPRFVDRNSQS